MFSEHPLDLMYHCLHMGREGGMVIVGCYRPHVDVIVKEAQSQIYFPAFVSVITFFVFSFILV